eukprot:3228666-Rhodomonas_salina.2
MSAPRTPSSVHRVKACHRIKVGRPRHVSPGPRAERAEAESGRDLQRPPCCTRTGPPWALPPAKGAAFLSPRRRKPGQVTHKRAHSRHRDWACVCGLSWQRRRACGAGVGWGAVTRIMASATCLGKRE